jgi:hypothetical protein
MREPGVPFIHDTGPPFALELPVPYVRKQRVQLVCGPEAKFAFIGVMGCGCFAGRVYTLVRPEDLRHFRALLRKIDGSTPSSYLVDKEALDRHKPVAAAALTHAQGLEA